MDSKTRTTNLVNATLGVVIVILALLVPAYSQQDVAPSWYDPYATASKASVQHPQAQSQTPSLKNKKVASSASPTGRKSKTQARVQATSDRNRKELAAK
jgi:hypothetical protein